MERPHPGQSLSRKPALVTALGKHVPPAGPAALRAEKHLVPPDVRGAQAQAERPVGHFPVPSGTHANIMFLQFLTVLT